MAQFVNAKADLVKEAIDGLLACSGGTLARLDGYPHIKALSIGQQHAKQYQSG